MQGRILTCATWGLACLLLAIGSSANAAQPPAAPADNRDPQYGDWLKQTNYNKSWIAIDWRPLQGRLTEGDKIEVPVEYSLDPAEHHGATTLTFEGLGPRVPMRNAPKPITFDKTQHLYYGQQSVKIEPGQNRHVFTLTVPKTSSQNSLLLLASFSDDHGKRWPWDVRAETWFARKGGRFELESEKPGNLFTYDGPVRIIARLKNVAAAGEKKLLKYKVYDYTKAVVAEGSQPFTVEADGQTVPVDLNIGRRGIFLFQAEVEGWENRETTFCRIPDIAAITHGELTRLGFTVHAAPHIGVRTPETLQIAKRLGLTSCRAFTEWTSIEPGPRHFVLEPWDAFFDAAAANHVQTVITIYDPPAWVLPRGQHIGYQMFPCNLDVFRDLVTTVSKRYRGKFWGWEWLNEITPGGTPDYVGDYVKLCRAGVEAARSVDPDLHSVLAGGLWPRGYRLDVLNAGAGKYVDVLPIHYGDGNRIQEAREDLDSFGHPHTRVWENESAAFVIQWDSPGLDVVSETTESKWVMTQWTDELSAGCEKLIYFGGEGDAIGNGDYLRSDLTPLPVAATLGVFAAKTFHAAPIGVFSLADGGGRFHLFNRDGQALLVAETGGLGKGESALFVGARSVRITDCQGNESEWAARDDVAQLPASDLPYFLEGADLDVLKVNLVASIVAPSSAGRTGLSRETPQVTLLQGRPGSVQVRLQNPYNRPLSGKISSDLAESGVPQPRYPFRLKAGERTIVSMPVSIPSDTQPQSAGYSIYLTFDDGKLPKVRKSFALSFISPDSLGNLLKNGDFEEADSSGKSPRHWQGTGAELAPSEGLGLGLGKHVLKFPGSEQWANFGQSIPLRGGATYLYTAWIWNRGKEGGSNIMQTLRDGRSRPLYDNQVINMGDSTPGWQVFTCRYQAPNDLAEAAFVPVARGRGTALYDNLRVTVFEGSDFAAEAIKAPHPPKIDGSLDDWDGKCPIPLIGRNQLGVTDKDYQWTPQNLSGVAYLRWVAEESVRRRSDVLDVMRITRPATATRNRDRRRQCDFGVRSDEPRRRRRPTESFAYYALSAAASGRQRPAYAVASESAASGGATRRATWRVTRRFTK